VERFEEAFDRWWEDLEASFSCVVRRTHRTMSWRYLQHPRHRYTVWVAQDPRGWRGLAVVRHGQSRGMPAGFVTELLTAPDDAAAMGSLLNQAADFLANSAPEPPVFLRCTQLHPALQRGLARARFFRVPSPLRWMTAPAADGAWAEGLRHRAGWMLNSGDSDLDTV
jgi:hypothetical protein